MIVTEDIICIVLTLPLLLPQKVSLLEIFRVISGQLHNNTYVVDPVQTQGYTKVLMLRQLLIFDCP